MPVMTQEGTGADSTSLQKEAARRGWAEIIKRKRAELDESQVVFGRRFGVSSVAVSYWETGVHDPPGEVTWWLTHNGAPDAR